MTCIVLSSHTASITREVYGHENRNTVTSSNFMLREANHVGVVCRAYTDVEVDSI